MYLHVCIFIIAPWKMSIIFVIKKNKTDVYSKTVARSNKKMSKVGVKTTNFQKSLHPYHAEYIPMPHPLLIVSQSDYLIQIVDIY